MNGSGSKESGKSLRDAVTCYSVIALLGLGECSLLKHARAPGKVPACACWLAEQAPQVVPDGGHGYFTQRPQAPYHHHQAHADEHPAGG